MNPLTGEKQVIINGNKYTLRFTWRAIAEIRQKYGDDPNMYNPEAVACICAAGMRERHPEMTAERIMELSPPLFPLVSDLQEALQWAYFGAQAIPEESQEDVKKNLPKAGLWPRIKRLWSRVSAPLNSGS